MLSNVLKDINAFIKEEMRTKDNNPNYLWPKFQKKFYAKINALRNDPSNSMLYEHRYKNQLIWDIIKNIFILPNLVNVLITGRYFFRRKTSTGEKIRFSHQDLLAPTTQQLLLSFDATEC